MSEIIQNIVILIGFVLVAGLGYYMYTESRISTGPEIDVTSAQSAQFLAQIKVLQSLSLDTSLFADQRFRELQSYRPALVPVSVGNSNPFVSE